MGISLDELVFDPANPDSSANVGAWLRAGDDGTAIGHVGDALKANVDGSTVELGATSLAALENITVEVSNEVEISNDAGNPVPVNATDFDIRNLVFADDKVDASGSEVKQDSYDSFKNTAQSVTNAATALAGTPLANRVKMLIQNLGTQDIFIGADNAVTDANGIKVPRGASAEFMFSAASTPHAITSAGTADVRILEMAY